MLPCSGNNKVKEPQKTITTMLLQTSCFISKNRNAPNILLYYYNYIHQTICSILQTLFFYNYQLMLTSFNSHCYRKENFT